MMPLTDANLIRVGGPSNARDVGSAGGSTPPRGLDEVLADMQAARRSGARLAILVGGEPTVRRDLPLLLKAAEKTGLAIGLATNGRMLSYPAVRAALVKAGVVYVRVALHGPRAEVHDPMVRVEGAFQQTFDGLVALLREAPASCRIDVACTVTKDNHEHLEAWVDSLAGLPRSATLGLRLVAPWTGLSEVEWAESGPMFERVSAALERAVAAGADIVVAWEGFPPCLLPSVPHLRDETLRYGIPMLGPDEAGGAIPTEPAAGREHPYPCQECVNESTCPGAPRPFLARFGESALRPTRAVRANSFNYELVRELSGIAPRAGSCPVRAIPMQGDLCRTVFLARDNALSMYHSPTSDFTDAEVRRVKDDTHQLYIDLSEGAALTDFMAEVRRVRWHDECRGCGDKPACPGTVVADAEPPFQREERWLRKEVSRLRGRVLDVGCGDQLYREELAALLANHDIEYHGLDPDAAALARFGEAVAGGELHHGTIEDFSWEPGYFDYVLCFRSINHFRDMVRSFQVISRLMRVQGQMVLCDSPPFGMLRRPAQVSFADHHAPVGHEHFRNWTSYQVVEFLKRFPFRVNVHRPVNSQTSNQWIVKVMRVGDGPPADETR
jgi:MoaA/NifB/PqqE/SkfB family radical SAM enzyme/ubiquinone/menaquinone biosynthesis C-methylase UbiE